MKKPISQIEPGDRIKLAGGQIITAAGAPERFVHEEFRVQTVEGCPCQEIAGSAEDEFEMAAEEAWPEELSD